MRKKVIACYAGAVIYLLFSVSSVLAAAIVLKSGEKIEGEIVEKNEYYVTIKSQGVTLPYPLSDIAQIIDSAAPSSGAGMLAQEKVPDDKMALVSAAVAPVLSAKEYFANKQYPECIEAIKQSMALMPNEPHLIAALGGAYYYAGNYKESAASFERALEIEPRLGGVREALAILYNAMGEKEKARQYLSEAIKEYRSKDAPLQSIIIAETLNQKLFGKE